MKTSRMQGKYASETYEVDGVVVRRCVFCGEVLPLETQYQKNGKNPDGTAAYRKDCRVCYNARRKENNNKIKHTTFINHQKQRGETDVNYTHQMWKEAVIFFGGECAYCGSTPRRGKVLTKDHIKALNNGGRTIQSNIIPSCGCCNSSKGDQDVKAWYMKQSFFSQDRLNKIFKWRRIMQEFDSNE